MTSEHITDPETLRRARCGDRAAEEAVIASNLGLVKSIAVRFLGRGVEFDDLVQLGTVGMIKAVRGFDPERECKFTTYAVPHIMGEIRRFLRDDDWIKISRETRSDAARIFRFQEEYEKKRGISPTVDEICSSLDLTREKAVFAMESARPALSLSAEDETTGFSPEKIIGEDNIEAATEMLSLKEALETLSLEERKLITLRYFKSLTQIQTARILGLSQVKVSRQEKKILEKLRKQFVFT